MEPHRLFFRAAFVNEVKEHDLFVENNPKMCKILVGCFFLQMIAHEFWMLRSEFVSPQKMALENRTPQWVRWFSGCRSLEYIPQIDN